MRAWWIVVVVVVVLGGCVLPGRSGWECDDAGDCQSGLECRSMHGDGGYSSICVRPGESVYVGSTSNWLRFMIWPLAGLAVAIGIASRIVAARKRRRETGL